MRVIIDSLLHVPESLVPQVERQFSVRPRAFDGDTPEPIPCYRRVRDGLVGVAIDKGLSLLPPQYRVEDATSRGSVPLGASTRPDFSHPMASAGQADFAMGMLRAVREEWAVLATAPTGSGKTVSALWVAAELDVPVLAVVPTTEIAKQWRAAAKRFLGLPDSAIGRLDGEVKRIAPFTVAVINTAATGNIGGAEREFGFVIYDEVHRVAARTFSRAVMRFPARYKLGLTATPQRRDGADKVFLWYFGKPKVVARANALPVKVKVLYRKATVPAWARKKRNTVIYQMARDRKRNTAIAKRVFMAADAGHDCLVVSDSVVQLKQIEACLREWGVPENEIGLFAGEYEDEDGKRHKLTDEYLAWVKRRPAIVLATYGKMKEGTDIPRLSWGIDATPRSEATQVIGRIRRPHEGKKSPVWETVVDVGCAVAERAFHSRMRDYRNDRTVTVEEKRWAN